ncbi:hypothetical protein BJ508DRAFT_416274 [Ascobolus immersus RN42]|uniref:Uncharacterized protein n=1 Tax=Ascobolus immersus RN42 TaxID=1160509 RepID=A0A3N4HYK5_ASCIM|nr:hypothetical protein BJ508DRAFT_416274 [Ascobolus immersus RN42]
MSNTNNSNSANMPTPTDPNTNGTDSQNGNQSLDEIRRARTAHCPYMNSPHDRRHYGRDFYSYDPFFGPSFPFGGGAFGGPFGAPFPTAHDFFGSPFDRSFFGHGFFGGPFGGFGNHHPFFGHHGFGHCPYGYGHHGRFSGAPRRELFEDPFQSFDMDFHRAITAPSQAEKEDNSSGRIHTLGGDETELDAYNALEKSRQGEKYLVGTIHQTQSKTGPDGITHTRSVIRRRYSDGTEEVDHKDYEQPAGDWFRGAIGMGERVGENSKVLKALEEGLGEQRSKLRDWMKEGESLWKEAWEKGKEIVKEINEGKGGDK